MVPGAHGRIRIIADHDKAFRSRGRPFPLQRWRNILPFAGIFFGNHAFMLKGAACYFHLFLPFYSSHFTPPILLLPTNTNTFRFHFAFTIYSTNTGSSIQQNTFIFQEAFQFLFSIFIFRIVKKAKTLDIFRYIDKNRDSQ